MIKEYKKDDVPGLAAEMAYHFIFALFPFFLFLATVAGLVGRLLSQDQLVDQIVNSLSAQLPGATAEALREPLQQVLGRQANQALSISAGVGLVLTLYSASNGIATIMKAFNRAYGVEETRGFIKQKLISIGLTIVLSLLLIVGFVSLAFGNDIIRVVAGVFDLGGLTQIALQVAQVVLGLLGIALAFAILYWQAPNVDQTFRWVSPGSLCATAALALLTVGFGLYVNLVGAASYAKTYGAAFGLILFLYFLFLASQVIVLGAELNAETAKRYDPDTIRDKITDPRKQLPGEQPMPHPQALKEAGVSPEQVAASNANSAAKVATGGGGPEAATRGGASSGVGGGTRAEKEEKDKDGASKSGSADVGAADIARRGITPASPRRMPDRSNAVALAMSAAASAGALAIGVLTRGRKR